MATNIENLFGGFDRLQAGLQEAALGRNLQQANKEVERIRTSEDLTNSEKDAQLKNLANGLTINLTKAGIEQQRIGNIVGAIKPPERQKLQTLDQFLVLGNEEEQARAEAVEKNRFSRKVFLQNLKSEASAKARAKLPVSVRRDLAKSVAQVRGIARLRGLSERLAKKNKLGPLAGRISAAQKLIGIQDPDVQRFISLQGPLNLAIAAALNQGRPSEKDLEIIVKANADLKDNPAAALAAIDEIEGALKRTLAVELVDLEDQGFDVRLLGRGARLDLAKERADLLSGQQISGAEPKGNEVIIPGINNGRPVRLNTIRSIRVGSGIIKVRVTKDGLVNIDTNKLFSPARKK